MHSNYLILIGIMTASTSNVKFNRDAILDDNLIRSTAGISLDECILECANRPVCESITYSRRYHYCILYNTVAASTIIEPGTTYGEKSWWYQISSIHTCNITCSSSQTCDLTAYLPCSNTECSKPTDVYNADSIGNIRNVGSKVLYNCIVGASSNDGGVISTCGGDGNWTNVTVMCDLNGFVRKRVGYRYPMTANGRGIYGDVIYHDVSRLECTNYCKLEIIFCQAVSYRQENRTCILVDGIWPPILDDGWEAIHKIFPTFYAFGPNGRYTLTYEEGTDYCLSSGTTMAELAEVRKSYDMGYNRLDCGWVAGRVSILPTHYTVPNYWTQTGLGYCTWQTRWGVFCLDPLYPVYG